LLAAVRTAIEKHRTLRREQAELTEIRARLATLTPREREVLEYVVTGKLNKQIAGDLGTVEQTVKVHRAHVMQKMRVRSVAELVRLMQRCGIGGVVPLSRPPNSKGRLRLLISVFRSLFAWQPVEAVWLRLRATVRIMTCAIRYASCSAFQLPRRSGCNRSQLSNLS